MAGNDTSRKAIENIGRQVERLMEEHRKVTAQRDELADECGGLQEENRSLKEQVKRLESELSFAQISEGLAGDERNRKKARARVNRLLREVDRCIAIAGNLETEAEQP